MVLLLRTPLVFDDRRRLWGNDGGFPVAFPEDRFRFLDVAGPFLRRFLLLLLLFCDPLPLDPPPPLKSFKRWLQGTFLVVRGLVVVVVNVLENTVKQSSPSLLLLF